MDRRSQTQETEYRLSAIPEAVPRAKRHIDGLREDIKCLEKEMKDIAGERKRSDSVPGTVTISKFDALVLASQAACVAINAMKVGSDIFEHVKEPEDHLLRIAREVFSTGMPLVRLARAIGELPRDELKKLSQGKEDWPLPEGLLKE